MNKTIAIDTNILVYCHSDNEPDKQEKAMSLFTFYPVVSTQVLSEYINVVKRKLSYTLFRRFSSWFISGKQDENYKSFCIILKSNSDPANQNKSFSCNFYHFFRNYLVEK